MPNTFTYVPAYGARLQSTPRVRSAQFGDGYQQRVADGINSNRRVWNLTFSKTQSDIDTILNFLEGEAGVTAFTWTPPRGSSGSWVCPEWGNAVNDGYDQLTATFIEVFE